MSLDGAADWIGVWKFLLFIEKEMQQPAAHRHLGPTVASVIRNSLKLQILISLSELVN